MNRRFCFMLLLVPLSAFSQSSIPTPVEINEVSAMITLLPGFSIESAFQFPTDEQLTIEGETIQNPLFNLPAEQPYLLITKSAFISKANLLVGGGAKIIIIIYDYYKGSRILARTGQTKVSIDPFGFVENKLLFFFRYSDSQDTQQRLVVSIKGDWGKYVTVSTDKSADLNLDGTVNGIDLLLLQSQWKIIEE